ncbi:MAG: UDP-glucose/GDP-mannose dehydrogenase family protein [Methanomassiliicoccus sp.]|nr:UDP-glucose/GDP-mannose dehydrogenase family protein [Methanomassiliicoccus sp.]
MSGGQQTTFDRLSTGRDANTKVTIVGAGYVGLVTGLCLADMGSEVTCIDVVTKKVDMLNAMECPIFEKDLDVLLARNTEAGRFHASPDMDEVASSDVTFICVGTPSREDGSLNLQYVLSAAREIGEEIRQKDEHHIIVVKSTVTPGTTEGMIVPELERSSGKEYGRDFGVAVNPEFLREGDAVRDFNHPDRIVIGSRDQRSLELLRSLYSSMDAPIIEVTPTAAEMTKLASNAFLAARISLMNEIGNICKTLGVDVRDVARGVGSDKRIGSDFLRAGCGFGGSCFPKDVRGLAALGRESGVEPVLLDGILSVNEAQGARMVGLLEKRMDIKGRNIAILGLAFKPFTDDVREAVSKRVAKELLSHGARVLAHDYRAEQEFRTEFPGIKYCSTPEDCITRSDAVLILTEWPGYADPSLYGDKLVIDGRGIVHTSNYEGVCW